MLASSWHGQMVTGKEQLDCIKDIIKGKKIKEVI